MTCAFVLGNGISRQCVSLTLLQSIGPIYGCNALYRDFEPAVLVATDAPIAQLIQQSGYSVQHRFHTRKPLAELGALPVPEKYYTFSSGPIAVALAALDGHSRIFLVGFDMGPVNSRFNNMYADTEFYKASTAPPTFTGNWQRQIRRVALDFPNQQFVRVQGPTTADAPEITHLPLANFSHMHISKFLQRINKNKEP
jgi:hypothetical protein